MKLTMKRCASLLLLGTLMLVPALASANGDFAGTWKLDPEKSKGMRPEAPTDVVMTIALEGENLVVERIAVREEGPDKAEWTYVTDGEPHEIVGKTLTRITTANWKGKKLQVSYKLEIRGIEVDVSETWKMKKSGLYIKYVSKVPDMGLGNQQTFITKQLFVRQ
jgi:hypothetical protein